MITSVCVMLRQPMATMSCGGICRFRKVVGRSYCTAPTHARAQAFVDVRMVIYLPDEFTPKDANITVLVLIAPRVGNAGYRGRCR